MDTFFNFYTIDLSHYEEREIFYFVGPASYSQEEFDTLCKSLIPEATLLTLANASNQDIENYDGIVTMLGIVIELAKLLKNKGFIEIKPKTSLFFGNSSRVHQRDCPEMGTLIENVIYQNDKFLREYSFDEET